MTGLMNPGIAPTRMNQVSKFSTTADAHRPTAGSTGGVAEDHSTAFAQTPPEDF
jgi:hypothetical protein